MLKSLSVDNFAVTKSASLDFSEGFCALTGETGAGKSMLVDALSAALGARADVSWIRQGERKATVAAVFEPGDKAKLWLNDKDIACDDSEVSLRRVIEIEGRSKAWINGVSVSASELRELGSLLAAIHGQHESVALLGSKAQREHLDAYAQCSSELQAVESHYKNWVKARTQAEHAKQKASDLSRERSQWIWEFDELARVSPLEGEWDRLDEELKTLSRAEEIQQISQAGVDELSDSEPSLIGRLSKLAKTLSALPSSDTKQAAMALEQAADSARDAYRVLLKISEQDDVSGEQLQNVELRVKQIYDLSRKLRIAPQDLPARMILAQEKLSELEQVLDVAKLEELERASLDLLNQSCITLSQKRQAASLQLSKSVSTNLAKLGMPKATLTIEFSTKDPGIDGSDFIEFCMAGYAGAKPLPLAKCASGGELARIGLALCAASLTQEQPGCLLFDEVDAGIGGPTASAVGLMLWELGQSGQTLAVTHLPQVAASADKHFSVGKKIVNGVPQSIVKAVDQSDREHEIARMLGDATSDSALEHAKSLLVKKTKH